MTVSACSITAFVDPTPVQLGWREARSGRSARTSPWSRVDEPSPSAAAITSEPDSLRAGVATVWLLPVVDRLNHLFQLRDGWDGPGTFGTDRRVLIRALEALSRIASPRTRPPSISPGSDGSLQLAWYTRDFELEIDVPLSGEITASLYEHSNGDEAELTLISPRLRDVIERLAID
jgi:hypothetical protein